MRIAFIGTSDLGIPALDALRAQGRHEVLIFTKPDQVGGRGRKVISSPLKLAAERLGMPCRLPRKINLPEVIEELKEYKTDVIVTASFWGKLAQQILDVPRFGGLNIHPSLLPLYRGAAPVQFALLRGDRVTGVTIFRMGRRMDAGAILGQVKMSVSPRDNQMTLHLKLAVAAAPLLLRVLDGLETGKIKPRPQDESRVIMARKLSKQDGAIDWNRSPHEIACKIRAFTPWPGAFLFLMKRKAPVRLIITEGRVLDEALPDENLKPGTVVECSDRLVVACGGGLLEILRIKREGKKEMSAQEFLRGVRLEKGMVLSSETPER